MRRIGSTQDMVGESPVWDHRRNCLYWVDIVGKLVRRLDPADGSTRCWKVHDFPTALSLAPVPDTIMLTQGLCFGRFDLSASTFQPLVEFERGESHMRLNEGACDPFGRFWTASMDNNLYPDGAPRKMGPPRGKLYCVGEEGGRGPFVHALGIPNTMAWSPDGRLFYFGDTTRNIIWAFDYEPETGKPSNQRVFVEGGPGLPDGSAVDCEGHLWNARFGAGCVIRFAPDGTQDRVLELPATNPTACAFGGADFSTLYMTTGRFGLSNPGAGDGALFAANVGVRGLPSSIFGEGRPL